MSFPASFMNGTAWFAEALKHAAYTITNCEYSSQEGTAGNSFEKFAC
ncbi:hypothetical protein PENANT_c002G06885 [Penicillium antarcticum]|uniref:Uncharacterized protein n=1 Tax=Penicillium antarcticum TaxID=416450 RepID=A0A1V6QKL2_9EURO|nr:hypothetical protein PENANT_c002G06885 [Penicillium antarcticum]